MPVSRPDITERKPQRPPAGFGEGKADAPSASGRASPPRAPQLPPALQRAATERTRDLEARRATERRSMLRGLLLLALVVLGLAVLQFGWTRALPPDWWQRW